jgi:hypothetical protein
VHLENNEIPPLIGLDSQNRIVFREGPRRDETWFFLGDVHADPDCLNWVFKYIKNFKNFRLCLLGDIFDRGIDEIECFKLILKFAREYPNQVMWLAGNHDRPIEGNQIDQCWPLQLINLRNVIMSKLPLMVFLSGGIMAMHGGPPSIAALMGRKLENITFSTEIQKLMQQSRFIGFKDIVENSDSEHWFNVTDLSEFLNTIKKTTPPIMLIRGHDHPIDGYQFFNANSDYKILTLLGSSKIGVQFIPNEYRNWTTIAQLNKNSKTRIIKLLSDGSTKTLMTEDQNTGNC